MLGISRHRKPFSVRSKILLTIGITIAILSVVVYLISTRVLLTSYKQIEEAGVLQDLGRAHDTFDNFAHQQQIKVNDWSQWDDAYDYAHTHDEDWFERTAFPAGMANADISYFIFSDNTDHIYRLRVIDIEGRVEIAVVIDGSERRAEFAVGAGGHRPKDRYLAEPRQFAVRKKVGVLIKRQ